MRINGKKINLLLLLILIIHSHRSSAQFFNGDQNPPSLNWRQINTESFRILYPARFESEAQRMVNTIKHTLPAESHSIKHHPYKITIILQNQGVTSNGFVQLAPRRSEFFTTPSQNFDYQDWLNSLVVHEMRHVVQFDKMSGKLRKPFLESLGLAVFGVSLPPWFYEGDAVGIETSLTRAGRGRIPEWSLNLRSNLIEGKRYSYSKDFLDSYRDFTPGYYQLGFYMTTKLRRDFGADAMDSAFTYVARKPWRPYSLSRAIRSISGMNTRQLHDSTISELQKKWRNQNQKLKSVSYPRINIRRDSIPANYQVPIMAGDGKIFAVRNTKAEAPAIIEIDRLGRDKLLLGIGVQETPWISYGAGKIVWDETRYDGRFQKRSYSVICVYNIQKKRRRQLTSRSRYFAPAMSPDGRMIACVEVDESNRVSLVLLDAEDGRVQERLPSPENQMLQMPSFDAAGKRIAMTALLREGKSILEYDLITKKFSPLLPSQLQDLQRPVYIGDDIIFKAHFNGIDNLYQIDRNKQIFQLSNSKTGLSYPFYDTNSSVLVSSIHSSLGFDLTALKYPELTKEPLHVVPVAPLNYADKLEGQEHHAKPLDSVPRDKFYSTPYSDLAHPFYFHSLVPVVEDNEFADDYNFGLEVQSNNLLNTVSAYGQYRYNNYLRKSEYLAGLSFSRYFPVFSIQYTNQARMIYRRQASNGQTRLSPVNWREHEIEASVKIPLSYNHFNHYYGVSLSAGTSYTSRYDIANGMSSLVRQLKFPMHYRLGLSHSIRRAGRDLAPRWGQSLILNYRNFPFDDRLKGDLFTLESHIYFPGLLKNHSLQVNFNYRQGKGNYVNNLNIPLVNGYSYLRHHQVLHNTFLLDYRLPIAYPDWELGDLAYIKRVKAGIFSDFENIGHNKFSPRSFGAELRADMNLLRFYLPVFDLGARMIIFNQNTGRRTAFEIMATYSY